MTIFVFAALLIKYLDYPLAPEYPLALFGAIARRHVGLRVDIKSASRFDDLILVYDLKVEREYGSIKSFCAGFCRVKKILSLLKRALFMFL